MKNKIFGFEVGNRVIDIEAGTEKEALVKLVENFWDFIDNVGSIELLGLLKS